MADPSGEPDLSRWPGARWRPIDDRDLIAGVPRGGPDVAGHVCADVVIRRITDGIERTHVDDIGFSIHGVDVPRAIEGARYWWSDGNGGCDCNRSLFFLRAGGEPEPEDDVPCTHGEFAISYPPWLADDPVD